MFKQVKLIIVNAYKHYLEEVLAKNIPEKHEQLRNMFDTHMEQIAQFCMDNYINKSELTESFIKGLHKSFFPPGYTQSMKMANGRWEVIYMIPGQYKTINNTSVSYLNPSWIACFLDCSAVKPEMQKLIRNFNIDIQNVLSEKKRDIILYFLIDFLYIHPFGDANWRVACILVDLMFIKNRFSPLYYHLLKEKNLEELYKAIELSRQTRDLKYLYEVIEKYST